ncbi:hypothetical protein BWQ96_06408 [Gracilariopsis chorda]|uniref:UVR domain-containing protein n=1 Tax=Gracilariopsis chorda TaxID=448386 RepID=A0A2V3IP08_9FLOR|nr:hypothetical protein BWQ96_06408 [Gracilariopsis chorda]|eukprot:PXF43787.1 hypothetical protein BWQ96_06408 [Gracilariopsis chorda]
MSLAFLLHTPFYSRSRNPRSSVIGKHCGSRPLLKPVTTTQPVHRARIHCCTEQPAWKRGPVDVDFAKDEQLQILEEDLDDALQLEDFKRASGIRDKLVRLQSGAYVAVLSAHMKFYKAFSYGSIVDIAASWLQEDSASCKHPLGPLVSGYLEVINSFGYVFSAGIPQIDVKNVCITMRGSVAYVTCEEHSTDWEANNGKGENTIMNAINIFTKKNGQWYICHHSALPVTGRDI